MNAKYVESMCWSALEMRVQNQLAPNSCFYLIDTILKSIVLKCCNIFPVSKANKVIFFNLRMHSIQFLLSPIIKVRIGDLEYLD